MSLSGGGEGGREKRGVAVSGEGEGKRETEVCH